MCEKCRKSNKLTDKNRLSITNPELCKEWDYEKNYPLKPKDISCGSNKKVGWKCKKGHKYDDSPMNRTHTTKNHTVCRVCRSFAFKYPELLKEWYTIKNINLDPWKISFASHKKAQWICKNGHEYESTIRGKTSGRVCLICESLGFKVPKLAKEWHPTKNGKLTPWDVFSQSNKKRWWVCSKGHVWKVSPNTRNNKNPKKQHNCPNCSGRRVCLDNCLATKYPKIAKEWHPTKNGKLTSFVVTASSGRNVQWLCSKCNNSWPSTIDNRTHNKNGCPYCAGKKAYLGNCLATINPRVVKEWHPTKNGKLTPYDITSGSAKKIQWICRKGHEWKAAAGERKRYDCPVCSKIVLKDGTVWDSKVEAYYYLKLKGRKIKFKHHGLYGFRKKKYRFDFYFPDFGVYVEITGFNKYNTTTASLKKRWQDIKKPYVQKKYL